VEEPKDFCTWWVVVVVAFEEDLQSDIELFCADERWLSVVKTQRSTNG